MVPLKEEVLQLCLWSGADERIDGKKLIGTLIALKPIINYYIHHLLAGMYYK